MSSEPSGPTAPIVRHVAEQAFGAPGTVETYGPDDDSFEVDILACHRPEGGSALYSTLTLHRTPNALESMDLRVELAGAAPQEADWFPGLLATAAVSIGRDRWPAAPGTVFQNMVAAYDPETPLPHLLLTHPVWEELVEVDLAELDTDAAGRVHWLLALPISERELGYVSDYGFDALHELFAHARVAYDDPRRASLV